MIKNNLSSLINILFTPRCVLCNSDINSLNLCASCLSLCTPYPLHAFATQYHEYGALFYYEWAIRDLIKGAKFYRQSAHALALKTLIQQQLERTSLFKTLEEFKPDAITYVPTHPLKIILRSVDLPSLFASLLATKLNVPLVSLLKKKRWAPLSLIHSKQERKHAVKGSMALPMRKRVYERLVIVDDIYTTGSTFDETKKMLKDISRECRCVAIARTP